MSKRDELIAKYAADLKDKCGVRADMDLLTKVTIGCGPSIYNADAAFSDFSNNHLLFLSSSESLSTSIIPNFSFISFSKGCISSRFSFK